MTGWTYQDKPFDSSRVTLDKKHPDFIQGFVYRLHCSATGKSYIGKKNFVSPKKVSIVRGGKKKKILVGSDWETYYGSSDYVKADVVAHGPESFTREILHLCQSKAEMGYWETYEIFVSHALLRPLEFSNEWVSCRVRRAHLRRLLKAS